MLRRLLLKFEEYLDMDASAARALFEEYDTPEQVLDRLREFIVEYARTLDAEAFEQRERGVWIAKSASVAPNATLVAPCIIGENAQLRCGAYIRGGVIVGKGCVIGNSSEVKDSVLFDSVKLPHFNYVGDSVLGRAVHLGAGAVISNLKSTHSAISINDGVTTRRSTRRKLGALVGDEVEIGASAVICPGSVIGRGSIIYPLSLFRGHLEAHMIRKNGGDTAEISNNGGK